MVMRIVALKIRVFKSESAIHSNMAEQQEEEEEEEEHQENPDETADQGIIPGLTRLCLSTLTFLFSSTRLVFSFEFSKVVVSVSSLRRRIPMRRIKISSLRLNLLCPFQRLNLVIFIHCRFLPFLDNFLGSTHKYTHVTRVIDVLDHVNRITIYQKTIMSMCTPL